MNTSRIKSLLQAIYDVLPSPTNLVLWKLDKDAVCSLCKRYANLEHILSSCSIALSQGRYTWRHNEVLREIAHLVDIRRIAANKAAPRKGPQYVNFVPAGSKTPAKSILEQPRGLLAIADDWALRVDLNTPLIFPLEIVETNLRPDMVLWSRKLKHVIIIELTVPWETRFLESHQRKLTKYEPLVAECIRVGWAARCEPVDVGTRGIVGQSLWRLQGMLGIVGRERKSGLKRVSDSVEKASRWLWLKRSASDGWSKDASQ